MGAKTPTTQHVFRQRSPLLLAAACGATGLLLLGSLIWHWSDNPQPLFVSWILFGLAVVWSLFVRPAVLLDDEAVTIRSVVRDVHIPWVRITDVEFRWNLKVFVGERGYPAWAISSQVERPSGGSGGMFARVLPGRLDRQARADASLPTQTPKVTPSTVAATIEQARQEYAEAVAKGALPAAPDARVRVTWVPLSLVVLLLPALAVAVLSLT